MLLSLLIINCSSNAVYAFEILPVSITSVNINQSQIYELGESIQGSFVVQSAAERGTAYDLKYNLAIIEGGIPGSPTILYNRSSFNNIRVESGDTVVNFSYLIPESLPRDKDFKLQVQLFRADGTPLNWAYSPIKINITSIKTNWIDVQNALIKIKEVKYGPGEGPTIYEAGENIFTFEATKNNSDPSQKEDFYFKYSIHKFSSTGEIVVEKVTPVIFSSSNRTSVEIELPFLAPGMYLGIGSIYTSNDKKVSRDFSFKYTVAGDVYKIRNFTLFENLKEGLVSISGKPIDVSLIKPDTIDESYPDTDLLEVSVIIRDAAGKQIASGKNTLKAGINDVNSNVVFDTKIVNEPNAPGPHSAEIILSKDGNIIDKYKQSLSLPLSFLSRSSNPLDFSTFVQNYTLAILVFICIFIVFFIILKSAFGVRKTTIISLIVSFLFFAASVFWIKTMYASTTSVTKYFHISKSDISVFGNVGLLDPTITYFVLQTGGVNVPVDADYGYKLLPGQKFHVSVGVFSWRCLNRFHAFLVEIFTDKQRSKGELGSTVPNQAGAHYIAPEGDTMSDYQSNSSYGTFTAPTKPGFYTLSYDIENLQYAAEGWGASAYQRTGSVFDFETNKLIYNRSLYNTNWLLIGKTVVAANYVVLCPDGTLPTGGCSKDTDSDNNMGNNTDTSNTTTNTKSCVLGYSYDSGSGKCIFTACQGVIGTAINSTTGECYCKNGATNVPSCTDIPKPSDCVIPSTNSKKISTGEKIKLYEKSIVPAGQTCSMYEAELTCFNGKLFKPPFVAPTWNGVDTIVSGDSNDDMQFKFAVCRVNPSYSEI